MRALFFTLVFILSACGHQSPRANPQPDARVTFAQFQFPLSTSTDSYSECIGYALSACISDECLEKAVESCQEFSYTGQLCQAEDLTGADAEYQHGPWCGYLDEPESKCLASKDHAHTHGKPVVKHGPWCWDDRALNLTSECLSPWEFIKAETNIHRDAVCGGKYWYPVTEFDCDVFRAQTIERCLELVPHGYGQWGHKTDVLFEACLLHEETNEP